MDDDDKQRIRCRGNSRYANQDNDGITCKTDVVK